MLVNINYTIKFDEIPRKIQQNITYDVNQELEKLRVQAGLAAECLQEGDDQNIFKALQTVDELRKGLMLVDAKLRDCYNVLVGYQQELLQVETDEQPQSTEELLSQLQKTVEENQHGER